MTQKRMNRLMRKCEWYRAQLGEELAAVIEGDLGVTTPRMSERDRPTAQRYREVVRQLANS